MGIVIRLGLHCLLGYQKQFWSVCCLRFLKKKKNRDSITDVSANTGFSERKHSNLYLGNNSSSFDHFACFYHTRFKCNYDAECSDSRERNHNIDCGHKLKDFGRECQFWDSCCTARHRWLFGTCNSLIIIKASMARLRERAAMILLSVGFPAAILVPSRRLLLNHT